MHPGFNDLWGFGRRRIDMRPDDLEYMVAYQIGALQAIATYAGVKVTHLKPHGALNNMAAENSEYALAIGRAIKTVDPNIIYVALGGSEMEKAGRKLGLPVAVEGFCDRQYDDDGNLTSRKIPGSVLKDAAAATRQVIDMVVEQLHHLAQRQEDSLQGALALRPRRRADRRRDRTCRARGTREGRRQARAADRNDARLSGDHSPIAVGSRP